MPSSGKKQEFAATSIILLIVIFSLSVFFILKDSDFIVHVIKPFAEGEPDRSVVLNLTFDDSGNPWRDYSVSNLFCEGKGGANYADGDNCKWYGCANLIASSGDYIECPAANFSFGSGMAVEFWVKMDYTPTGGNSAGYFTLGNNYEIHTQEQDYGLRAVWKAQSGVIDKAVGQNYRTIQNNWFHYFQMYDNERYYLWLNGELIVNVSESKGGLNWTPGNKIWIGRHEIANIDIEGYLDEFLIYNRSNFTTEDVLARYNEKALGTPPELDVYVKKIKYQIPYNFSHDRNEITNLTGTMAIGIDIANYGTSGSGLFNYQVYINDTLVCSNRISVPAQSQVNETCYWPKQIGFFKGYVLLDTNNELIENGKDSKTNNYQRIYIPFLNRPFVHFSYEEWVNELKPYCLDSSNLVSYSSCDWFRHFSSDIFDNGWSGNDVDPRGKKAREHAMACLRKDYNDSSDPLGGFQCKYALDHLEGWSNRSISSYSNVQQIHELVHVGLTYDIMFPLLTEEQNARIVERFHNICQHITSLSNVRPYMDNKDEIAGDNGKGFGSGMAGFCYSILGAYPENPTLRLEYSQQHWGQNIVDEWMDREITYLRSMKNDSFARYEEGWLYKFYSQYHLLENWYFQKRMGLDKIEPYQNGLCAMANELITDMLDYTYNGNSLIGGQSRRFRGIQRGDSFSYEDPGSASTVGWDATIYYGLLCDDPNVKGAMLWLREKAYNISEPLSYWTIVGMYGFKQLESQSEIKHPDSVMPRFVFDNANDILTIRTGYSYQNDTLILIDGGEEKGNGHSQAQGYYLYALGEPFLDYEQVPYEDDVRAETWKNGISLQNTTQSVEGTGGTYSSTCGNAPLNQYYGMSSCPKPAYPVDYPDFRTFPLEYGGDVEDYIGTSDAHFAGAYVWRPYKNSQPVREYFVKFGDLLAKRTVVSGVTEGKGIYHNFISLNNLFTYSENGLNYTMNRVNAATNANTFMQTQLIYSSQPDLILGGGNTNVNACFGKTSCSGSNRATSTYNRMYYYTPQDNLDLIHTHHWYTSGNYQTVESLSGGDKGVKQGDNVIVFDTDGDGIVSYSGYSTDGWALAFSGNEVAAFNTTLISAGGVNLLQANHTISAHLKFEDDSIILTVNTMQRSSYIDFPKKVRVSVDASSMVLNSNFVIEKSGELVPKVSESGSVVVFDVQSSQNSDSYIITGQEADASPPMISSINIEEITNQSALLRLFANKHVNLTAVFGFSEDSLVFYAVDSGYKAAQSVFFLPLSPNSTVYYRTIACDYSGNCVTNGTFSFVTAENSLELPGIIYVRNSSITHSGFRVELLLNKSANATVFVWNSGSWAAYSSPYYSPSHNIYISSLMNNTLYYWQVNGSNQAGSYSSDVFSLTTRQLLPKFPNATSFNGRTTDFYSCDLSNVKDLILEKLGYGRIEFSGTINVSAMNLDENIELGYGYVFLDSASLRSLNRSAVIHLYNLDLVNPKILRDGEDCSDCVIRSYSSGNLTFEVLHFTEYQAVETETPANLGSSSGSPSRGNSGGTSGSGGSSAKQLPPAQEQPKEEPGRIVEEEPAAVIENEPISEPEPENPGKVEEESRAWLVLPLFFIFIGCIGFFAYKLRLKYRVKVREPVMTRKAVSELYISEQKKATNLYELARHLQSMNEEEFRMLYRNKAIHTWVAEHLSLPRIAHILNAAESKDEMYRMLYNISVKELMPHKKPVFRVKEEVLKFSFNELAETPLKLSNGLVIYSVDNLMRALPLISDDEFEIYANEEKHLLAEWAAQFNKEVSQLFRMVKTRRQMQRLLTIVKVEQELYRMLNELSVGGRD